MFNYKLLKDLGPDANVEVGQIYNEYFIITGVKQEPYFVKEAVLDDKLAWEMIISKRIYPELI